MEAINYARGGSNMVLPADAQIVQGVSGNAVYFPAGAGVIPASENRSEITISLWRQWDGVVDSAAYRGIFETANIKVYFDQETDLLTVEIADTKKVTDIKDDQEQAHWCFLFAKNSFFKIYKNAELKAEMTTGNYPVDFSEGFKLGGGRTLATFDELRIYKKVATEPEIRGLYFLITKGTQVQHLETLIANNTPKYLGVVETESSTRTAFIRKGEKLGAVDANPGDWVLSGKTIGGWKVGVCYRWTGAQWKALEPEANYAEEYQACLLHMFEIEELKQQTGHFGALFAKVLVAQKAMIDELIVRQLKIDSNQDVENDFEAYFDEINGLKIKNGDKIIFRVAPSGEANFYGISIKKEFDFNNTRYEFPDHNISPSGYERLFYQNKEVLFTRITERHEDKVYNIYIRDWTRINENPWWAPGLGTVTNMIELESVSYRKTFKTCTIQFKDGSKVEDTINNFVFLSTGKRFDVEKADAPPYLRKAPDAYDFGQFNLENIEIKSAGSFRDLLIIDQIPNDGDYHAIPPGTLYKTSDGVLKIR